MLTTKLNSGRSPLAQTYLDSHHQQEEKYQTLTPVPPVPPIPPISASGYNHNIYGPPLVTYPSPIGNVPPFVPNHGQGPPIGFNKIGITEPDSSTPDVRSTIENSFQVPSVSSTTSRQNIGISHGTCIPSNALPPHPSPAAPPSINMHHQPINNEQQQQQWDANNHQLSITPPNMQSQSQNEGEKVTKKKRKRCGECPGCLKKDNCGECGPCKSVRSHQICKMRKCDQLKTKKEKAREVRKEQ